MPPVSPFLVTFRNKEKFLLPLLCLLFVYPWSKHFFHCLIKHLHVVPIKWDNISILRSVNWESLLIFEVINHFLLLPFPNLISKPQTQKHFRHRFFYRSKCSDKAFPISLEMDKSSLFMFNTHQLFNKKIRRFKLLRKKWKDIDIREQNASPMHEFSSSSSKINKKHETKWSDKTCSTIAKTEK